MTDFYFGSSSPDFAGNYQPYGGGSGTSVLNKDPALMFTVPAGGITITELQRGMESAPSQAGITVEIAVYDMTGNPANPPLLGQAIITSRSDNAGYVWHTASGLSINVAEGKLIAVGSALPSAAVWHTRGAEISDSGAASTTLPSPWSGAGPAREIPLRAGYSLNTPPATIYNINGNNVVRVGSTGNSISTAGIGTLTSLTLGGKAAINLSAPAGDGTFDMPGFVDGASYSLMGSVTGIASDGTNSDDIPATLYPPEGYDFVTLAGTLNTSNTGVLYQFSPAAVVGDQIVFPLAITVDAQGNVDGDAGTYTLYEIRASDGVVRTVALTLGAAGSDTTPDAFGFNTPTLAALGATVTSTNTTISGINAAAAVSVTGGLVSINGGAFVTSGTITSGQTIAARVTASNSYSTAVTATVNIGGATAQFTATTIASDTTPDGFSFNAATNVAASSTQTSNSVTIAGLNTSAAVSVSGGTYSKNGGAYTSTAGTVVNGDTLTVQHTASASALTQVTTTLTIGTFSAAFSSTTAAAADTVPDQFSIAPVTGAALSTQITSASVTPVGYSAASALTVTGGTASINGGAFSASPGNISPGQSFVVRLASSAAYSTQASATVSIGGVSAQFLVTTIADPGPPPDTTPDAISFPANTNCTPNSAQSSAVRTIAGINTASPITAATNCTYSVAGGAATSANGSISNGQTIQLFAVASGAPGATVNASITIGGQVFTWVITTASAQYSPPPESNSTTFGKLKGIAMPIRASNAKRDIDQSTPEQDRTLQVGHEKQESYKLLLLIEKNGPATGAVDLYAKLITAKSYSLVGSVDLASITEISVVETGGPILSVMAVPVGVTGTFDFSYAGF